MDKLQGKNILIISPESWGKSFVSKHHYALELVRRGNQVSFLGPPSSKYDSQPSLETGLTLLSYPGFPKGFRFLPTIVRRLILRRITKKLESWAKGSFDIIWSFDNSVFFDLDAWGKHKIGISHIVDLNMDFQTQRASKTANICFCTTEFILRRLKAANANAHKIPHGVSLPSKLPSPKELPGGNKPKALYVGNLSMPYLDWEVLKETINLNPQVVFCFLGPEGKSNLAIADHHNEIRNELRNLPNVHFLGVVPAKDVFSYLMGTDICLVSYQERHHQDQASPHKIPEYLASGKTIVATFTEEYDETGLLQMPRYNKDFPTVFSEVANNLDHYNSETMSGKRVSYAQANTYAAHLVTIEKLIFNTPSHQ